MLLCICYVLPLKSKRHCAVFLVAGVSRYSLLPFALLRLSFHGSKQRKPWNLEGQSLNFQGILFSILKQVCISFRFLWHSVYQDGIINRVDQDNVLWDDKIREIPTYYFLKESRGLDISLRKANTTLIFPFLSELKWVFLSIFTGNELKAFTRWLVDDKIPGTVFISPKKVTASKIAADWSLQLDEFMIIHHYFKTHPRYLMLSMG